ncbi:MAG: EamA family transporter, partial [Myxococcales bacterium]
MKIRLAYITCCLLWGSTWMAIKIGLRDLPPLLFAGTRMMLAAAVLAVLGLVAFWPGEKADAKPVTHEQALAMKAPKKQGDPDAKPPRVQLAILLDTSGSMDGLIDQARTQIWGIVNALGEASRDGVKPKLELALYSYGESGFPNEIHKRLDFTTDLDLVSRELFALRTTGGFEPVGMVVDDATRTLAWTDEAEALKLIYVAGNEEVTQGNVNPLKAAAAAR